MNIIILEGADKSGKTTLAKKLLKEFPTYKYYHFTTCSKPSFSETDIPLPPGIPVFSTFLKFFNDHILSNYQPWPDRSNCPRGFILDRSLFSDIVYGEYYRGKDDAIRVSPPEREYFTLLLEALGAKIIFCNPSHNATEHSMKELAKENEGVITDLAKYTAIREKYNELFADLKTNTNLNIIDFDYTKYDQDDYHDLICYKLAHYFSCVTWRINGADPSDKVAKYARSRPLSEMLTYYGFHPFVLGPIDKLGDPDFEFDRIIKLKYKATKSSQPLDGWAGEDGQSDISNETIITYYDYLLLLAKLGQQNPKECPLLGNKTLVIKDNIYDHFEYSVLSIIEAENSPIGNIFKSKLAKAIRL
jgi:thymidylate kinase